MIAVNREKARALSEYFHVRVCTLKGRDWVVLGKPVADWDESSHLGSYELSRLEHFPGTQDHTRILFRGLKQQMQDFQPDIILVENEPWSLLRWQARWHAWREARGALFAEFTWENVRRPGIRGNLLDQIYRLCAKTSDAVICGNEAARRLFREAGMNPDRIMVDGQLGENREGYPKASPAERAHWRKSLGWGESDRVIGFCGRIVEEKGLKELILAVSELRAEFPDLRLVLVGSGDLENEATASDPEGNWLRILPPVPHREIPFFLAKIDAFVLPSKPLKSNDGKVWEEQFGHVLIEAMACGTLTLGSDSGAIPEILDDESVTFKNANSDSLRTCLAHWLGSTAARERKALEQRAKCLERWSHGALAARYAHFFKVRCAAGRNGNMGSLE